MGEELEELRKPGVDFRMQIHGGVIGGRHGRQDEACVVAVISIEPDEMVTGNESLAEHFIQKLESGNVAAALYPAQSENQKAGVDRQYNDAWHTRSFTLRLLKEAVERGHHLKVLHLDPVDIPELEPGQYLYQEPTCTGALLRAMSERSSCAPSRS